ncbi:MAG: helix-turn-helix transcriptional regulator [Clostridia bacterium]|nr:helix-turn-helix transcriptional regulator [Clostridia bacterium]
MYYPKQLPYLLDKEFKENIKYTEYNIKELEEFAMCIWTMKSKKIIDKTIYNYILPDACIDIVINFTDKTICFAGFSRDTIAFELQEKIDFMGVRLKPSIFYELFSIQADKIMDSQIDFFKIEKDTNLDKIFNVEDEIERINIFKTYLLTKIKSNSDKKYTQIIEQLYNSPKEQTVLGIASQYGYNQRHLYRLFKKHYGISPKILLNILRLHLCLTLLLEESKSITDVMNICGFYDQSHFIKEIKKYTGFSPLELIENYKV